MGLADDIAAYMEWSAAPRSPEEFERLRDVRMYLESALAEWKDDETSEWLEMALRLLE